MAHLEMPILVVSGALEQPHTEVELLNHIDVLVSGEVKNALGNREGVVSANDGHIAVGAVAKFSTTIAGGSPLLSRRCSSDSGGSESQ